MPSMLLLDSGSIPRAHFFRGFFGSEWGREIRFSKENKHNFRRGDLQKKNCQITKLMVAITEWPKHSYVATSWSIIHDLQVRDQIAHPVNFIDQNGILLISVYAWLWKSIVSICWSIVVVPVRQSRFLVEERGLVYGKCFAIYFL
jgi:hypothetical protein